MATLFPLVFPSSRFFTFTTVKPDVHRRFNNPKKWTNVPSIRLTSASRNATPTIAGCGSPMSLELCLFSPFVTCPIPLF
uniref:Secreted protein n=1 Tax=Mesocestoides corti TaxID=53468 RepID=A0A5K3FNR1_MESCO